MTTTAIAMADDGDESDTAAITDFERILARRTKVMFLRNAGATWSKVAEECGVSVVTVRKDYAVVCHDVNAEQPAHVVARHRSVIFDIQRANYPAMMRGDKDAAATILRALEREAKLLGLDSPTRILASVSKDDFANEAARLITSIAELDNDTLKELTRGQSSDPVVIEGDTGATDPPVDQLDQSAAEDASGRGADTVDVGGVGAESDTDIEREQDDQRGGSHGGAQQDDQDDQWSEANWSNI